MNKKARTIIEKEGWTCESCQNSQFQRARCPENQGFFLPQPNAGEIRIRVASDGVNRLIEYTPDRLKKEVTKVDKWKLVYDEHVAFRKDCGSEGIPFRNADNTN